MTRIASNAVSFAGTTTRMIAAFVCALVVPAMIQAQPILGPVVHG